MTTFATSDGTKKYAERFLATAAPGHFREQQGLWLSSLGIGPYLGEPDERTDLAYKDAIVAGGGSGRETSLTPQLITRFQRSERSGGAALAELMRRGFSREELLICTKGGFLTPDGSMPADASEYFNHEYVETDILREGDSGCRMPFDSSQSFLPTKSSAAEANLGVETIDVYYLHNPKPQLEL